MPQVDSQPTAVLNIVAPTLTTYGGPGDAAATITDENNILGDAVVNYYQANADDSRGDALEPLTTAPTNPGRYWAEITLGTGDNTATAHVVYTIAKATASAIDADTARGAVTINYTTEQITNIQSGYEVSTDAQNPAPSTGDAISLTDIFNGQDTPTIYVRTAETDTIAAGEWVAVTLPSRPDAPTTLTTESATNASTSDGKINGTTTGMEYSDDNGVTWNAVTANPTLVSTGAYLVRVKATDSAPAGQTVEVVVGDKQVEDVIAKINALPELDAVAITDKGEVEAARSAYDALNDGQKAMIPAQTLQKLTDEEEKLAVLQVLSEVSAKAGSDVTYTGDPIELINPPTSALPEGYTIKYAVTTENTAPADNLYNTSTPTSTNAGTYYVWYKVEGDSNHEDSEVVCVSVEIQKADIYPSASIGSWMVGEEPSTPTVEGNTGNGAVTYTYAVKGSTEFSETVPSEAGDYTLKASIAETENYNAGEATRDFVIIAPAHTHSFVDEPRWAWYFINGKASAATTYTCTCGETVIQPATLK